MGRKLSDENQRIQQKSIGFFRRQIDFFAKYPDFKPDTFCRKAVDEQIKLIDERFLEHETIN